MLEDHAQYQPVDETEQFFETGRDVTSRRVAQYNAYGTPDVVKRDIDTRVGQLFPQEAATLVPRLHEMVNQYAETHQKFSVLSLSVSIGMAREALEDACAVKSQSQSPMFIDTSAKILSFNNARLLRSQKERIFQLNDEGMKALAILDGHENDDAPTQFSELLRQLRHFDSLMQQLATTDMFGGSTMLVGASQRELRVFAQQLGKVAQQLTDIKKDLKDGRTLSEIQPRLNEITTSLGTILDLKSMKDPVLLQNPRNQLVSNIVRSMFEMIKALPQMLSTLQAPANNQAQAQTVLQNQNKSQAAPPVNKASPAESSSRQSGVTYTRVSSNVFQINRGNLDIGKQSPVQRNTTFVSNAAIAPTSRLGLASAQPSAAPVTAQQSPTAPSVSAPISRVAPASAAAQQSPAERPQVITTNVATQKADTTTANNPATKTTVTSATTTVERPTAQVIALDTHRPALPPSPAVAPPTAPPPPPSQPVISAPERPAQVSGAALTQPQTPPPAQEQAKPTGLSEASKPAETQKPADRAVPPTARQGQAEKQEIRLTNPNSADDKTAIKLTTNDMFGKVDFVIGRAIDLTNALKKGVVTQLFKSNAQSMCDGCYGEKGCPACPLKKVIETVNGMNQQQKNAAASEFHTRMAAAQQKLSNG
jgi:hypothetical protein